MRILSPSMAFRSLYGPWVVLPALTLEGVNLLNRHHPYLGEGAWTVDWLAIPLWIIGVVAAGVVAIDVARLLRPGSRHLVLTATHRSRLLLWATAWAGGPLLLVHTLTLITALVAGRVNDPSVGWAQMGAAYSVQCLGLLWFVALGGLIGRFIPPLLAGPVAVGAAFLTVLALSGASAGTPAFRLLNFGGATITLIGLRWNLAYLGVQALLLIGSGLFAVLVIPTVRGARLTLRWPALLTLIVIVAVIASATRWAPPGHRTVPAAAAAPTHCLSRAPVICIYYEHRRDAATIAATLTRLESAANRAGYSALVSDRLEESSRTYTPTRAGTRGFPHPSSLEDTGTLDPNELATSLLTPLTCPQLRDPAKPPPDSYWLNLESVVATWLHLAGLDPASAMAGDPEHISDKLSAQKVTSILQGFAQCKLTE